MVMNRGIRFLLWVLVGGLVALSQNAFAAKLEFKQKKTVIKSIELKGDLRLRQENFNKAFDSDRQRQRLRYRQELNITLPHNLKVKTRLASGGADPTSTNQTLDNNASSKGINIDRVYLEWKPFGKDKGVQLQLGKIKNPFWKSKVRDLVWDGDYNPEGASESFNGILGNVGLFANFGQFVLEEVDGTAAPNQRLDHRDVYLFVEEVGAEVKLPLESRLKAAVAHHEFANIRDNAPANSLSGNTAGSGFSLFQIHAVLSSWVAGIPVSLNFNHLVNRAAKPTTVGGALATADEQDTAVAAGVVVGKAKKKNSLEVGYFYKEIENDAHVQGIGDSDFHDGDLNSKGHIIHVAYAITDFIKAQIKHYDTEDKIVATGANDGSMTRTQFDLVVKFK